MLGVYQFYVFKGQILYWKTFFLLYISFLLQRPLFLLSFSVFYILWYFYWPFLARRLEHWYSTFFILVHPLKSIIFWLKTDLAESYIFIVSITFIIQFKIFLTFHWNVLIPGLFIRCCLISKCIEFFLLLFASYWFLVF